jgi:hypothetical protein
MQKAVAVGVSLTKEILAKIDTKRGDVPRSRYILRLIENSAYNYKDGAHT